MGRNCCGGSTEAPPPSQLKERNYVPSEEMGDYEELRKKKSPKTGPLYPLNEEGAYGAPPAPLPKPLPGYQKRERKPKVYAGYAVSSDCCMHADKLLQNEDHSKGQLPSPRRRTPSFSRSGGVPKPAPAPARRASTLPRNHSVRAPSPAPSVDIYAGGSTNWKNSLRGSSVSREEAPPRPRVQRPPAPRRERTPEPPRPRSVTPEQHARRSTSSDDRSSARSSSGSTDWGYTSYSSFLTGARNSSASADTSFSSSNRSSSVSKASSSIKRGSKSESFKENYSPANASLQALKAPIISPWDNMGILGLTSKMSADTSISKEHSFSASSFVRKESVSSHAM